MQCDSSADDGAMCIYSRKAERNRSVCRWLLGAGRDGVFPTIAGYAAEVNWHLLPSSGVRMWEIYHRPSDLDSLIITWGSRGAPQAVRRTHRHSPAPVPRQRADRRTCRRCPLPHAGMPWHVRSPV
jgi:hypothetical protein